MWTEITRAQYRRDDLPYASDTRAAEWATAPAGVKGFQRLPRRRVVERSFAWLGRSRRRAKDFEATIASSTD